MKKTIITTFILASLLLSGRAVAVAESVMPYNYIRTVTYLDSTANDEHARRAVTWYDGLGRERQTAVSAGSSGYATRKDYDLRGNLSRTWLPVPSSGEYLPSQQFLNVANSFYGWGETPYSQIEYEHSGLNRPVKEQGPGNFWNNKPVKTIYYNREMVIPPSCTMLTVNADGSVTAKGNYPDGTLRITGTVNEDGMETLTFENRAGKTVMERRRGNGQQADTRFIYDLRGDLRYVVSPEGSVMISSYGPVPSEVLEKYSQRFTYDHLHRVVSAAKAGCEPVEYVYDRLGNIILQSTGQQRVSSTWEIMKYDSRHRPAMRGLVTLPGKSRTELQNLYGDSLFTVRSNPSPNSLELDMGYTQLSGPEIDVENIATVWYYDNYNFICDRESQRIKPLFTSPADKPYANNGRLTGSCSNGTSSFRQVTAYRYDGKGNETFRLKWDIFLNSYVHALRTEYDFVNQPVRITETWQTVSEGTVTESHQAVTGLTYDDMGNLTRETLRVDDGEEMTLRQMTYDGIGRLTSEQGSVDVTYGYDIRSHLTSISSAPYSETAVYATDEPDPSYTFVNSTQDSWGSDCTVRFNYRYDSLGRLLRASTPDSKMSEKYEVDLNAAVTGIQRTYNGLSVMDAVKQYDGMKPVGVMDVSELGMMDAVARIIPGDYTMGYDRNGRLISDGTRDVTSISYHRFIDRPLQITFGNGSYIRSQYAPDGTLESRTHTYRKLITTVKVNSKGDTIRTTANRFVNEGSFYYGNFEQTNRRIRYNTSTGYYDVDSGINYQYLRNRQGSVMAVVDPQGRTVQRTGLYPTGTPFILPCDYRPAETNSLTPATDQLHIGNRWLSQSGLNYYDNTARMHDPLLADFKSGDPKFTDYPSLNHYSHCAANFANAVDPKGKNLLVVNKVGYVIEYEEKDGEDEVYIADENGKRIEAIVGIFDHGTFTLKEKGMQISGYNVDIFSINGNQGKDFFKFLATYTNVEWGLLMGKDKKGDLAGYLSTSHEEAANAGSNYISKFYKDINFTDDYHNHPGGSERASGIYRNYFYGWQSGDIEAFKEMDDFTGSKLNHYIYANSNLIKINPYEKKYEPSIFYNISHFFSNLFK